MQTFVVVINADPKNGGHEIVSGLHNLANGIQKRLKDQKINWTGSHTLAAMRAIAVRDLHGRLCGHAAIATTMPHALQAIQSGAKRDERF